MTKSFVLGSLIAMSAVLAGPALAKHASSANAGAKISATLVGSEETGGGDADGTGGFTGRINPGHNRLCYTLTYSNIGAATGAHIHKGAMGVSGPVFVPLKVEADGSVDTCATITRAQAMALIQHPGDYYINVHNAALPNGAIRGQLNKG